MAQTCKVCSHADRATIDMDLATNRRSERALAAEYGVSPSSMLRHRRAHLPKLLAQLGQRIGVLEADQVMAQMVQLYEAALKNLGRAEQLVMTADPSTITATAGAIREARRTLESMAALSIKMRQAEMQQPGQPVQVKNLGDEIAVALAARTVAIEAARDEINGGQVGANVASEPSMTTQEAESLTHIEDAEVVDPAPIEPSVIPSRFPMASRY
jgi:hypothetical protein